MAPALLKSPKSRLQEATQRATGGRPAYRVIEAAGRTTTRCSASRSPWATRCSGMGIGPSRRIAETAAAAEAVEVLDARAAERRPEAAAG